MFNAHRCWFSVLIFATGLFTNSTINPGGALAHLAVKGVSWLKKLHDAKKLSDVAKVAAQAVKTVKDVAKVVDKARAVVGGTVAAGGALARLSSKLESSTPSAVTTTPISVQSVPILHNPVTHALSSTSTVSSRLGALMSNPLMPPSHDFIPMRQRIPLLPMEPTGRSATAVGAPVVERSVLVELDIPKADPPSTATVPSPEPSAPSNSLLKDLAGAAINSVPPAIGLAAALVERSNIRAQKNNAKLAALSASKVAKARADEDEDKKAILNDVEL